jgi:ankyrin repeat protein
VRARMLCVCPYLLVAKLMSSIPINSDFDCKHGWARLFFCEIVCNHLLLWQYGYKGLTALHYATRRNHEDLVKRLLDRGAEVDIT